MDESNYQTSDAQRGPSDMSASALRVLDAVKCSRSDLAVPSASSHPLEVMGLKEQMSKTRT